MLILTAFTIIWIICVKTIIFRRREAALTAYKDVDKTLIKQYEVFQRLAELIKETMSTEISTIEYIEKLKNEVTKLGTDKNNIDRRIALDGELKSQTELLISKILEYQSLSANKEITDLIAQYKKNDDEFKDNVIKYNSAAHELRKAVDVFPYSFFARLSEVKSLDYIN